MARVAAASACRSNLSLRPRFLRVLVATLIIVVLVAPARSAWVEDYPSGVPCGVTIPVEQCDPADAAANSACMDVCHYGGCRRGGRCVSLGLGRGRGCRCKVLIRAESMRRRRSAVTGTSRQILAFNYNPLIPAFLSPCHGSRKSN